ncbi:hypothetical protein [Streptomyces sp. NPDC059874]|uniref:hypothetical protein n=1 Tax=Streptomyces sp. NPDC059874 TaxID=3346983 RepID=UPI003662BD7D
MAVKKITEKLSDEALAAETGRDWSAWFAELDGWGATGHTHTEIARRLVAEYGVSGWYAQSVTVGYEQERGMREVGQSCDGDWQTSSSRTVGAAAERVTEAFTDGAVRERWLPHADFSVRTHRPGKSVTADWDGGSSRISVYLTPKGPDRTQVGLGHTKLADADAVAVYKAFWKERLDALKSLLED